MTRPIYADGLGTSPRGPKGDPGDPGADSTAPGPQGDPGPRGLTGLPGVNAVANDTATAAQINDPDSETARALLASIAPAYGSQKHPLAYALEAARTGGPFRILAHATSIGTFVNSAIRVVGQQLSYRLGESASTITVLGGLGGGYESGPSGTSKQHYGGAQLTRLVLTSASSTVTLGSDYCDTIVVESSRETDSQAVTIYVDGVAKGTTPAAGAQAYRQTLTITLPLGHHTITASAPTGSGRAYLETLTTADSSRRHGVEYLNFALGGIGIYNLTNVAAIGTGQLAPVDIQGTNGLDYHFKRTDVSLAILQGPVNDGGARVDQAIANMDYAVEQHRLSGVPLLIVIEPMAGYPTRSDYQQLREHMLSYRQYYWVTVIDWHAALWPSDDLLDASVTAKALALYWPSDDQTHPNEAAHAICTALICEAFGIPAPAVNSADLVAHRYRHTQPAALTPGAATSVTIAGHTYALPIPEGVARESYATYGSAATDRNRSYYRLPLVTNVRDVYWNDSPRWLTTPDGTDAYGPYATSLDANGYGTDGQLFRITVRVSGGTAGAIISMRVPVDSRVEDDKGNQYPQTTDGGVTFTQISYGLPGGEAPVVLSYLVRCVNAAGNWQPGFIASGGRFYEATMLPVASASTPPTLSSATTRFGYYRTISGDLASAPASAVVAGKGRRYAKPAGAAFELRSASAADDLAPGLSIDGSVVPYYRDLGAPQVGFFQSGGGSFDVDPNATIAASSTSDAYGKYINYGGLTTLAVIGTTGGTEYSVCLLARGTVGFQAAGGSGGDARSHIVVNGVNRDGQFYDFANVEAAPAMYSLRVRVVATGDFVFRFSGRTYGIWVTESTIPLITT